MGLQAGLCPPEGGSVWGNGRVVTVPPADIPPLLHAQPWKVQGGSRPGEGLRGGAGVVQPA